MATSTQLEVTKDDVVKLHEYSRFVAIAWWVHKTRNSAVCDRCNSALKRFEGFASGDIVNAQVLVSRIHCGSCADKDYDHNALDELRKDPNYFGVGRLAKARDFSIWLRPTSNTTFKNICRERFLKNLPSGGDDLLSGEPVDQGKGYQITGGDFLASPKIKAMYMDYYLNKTGSEAVAEDEYWKLYVKCVIYPHNLVFSEKHIEWVIPKK